MLTQSFPEFQTWPLQRLTALMRSILASQKKHFLTLTLIALYARVWDNQGTITSQRVTSVKQLDPELEYVFSDYPKMILFITWVFAMIRFGNYEVNLIVNVVFCRFMSEQNNEQYSRVLLLIVWE